MASGKVKWFNNAKGYGFINEDGKDEDLFAHYSAIQMDGFRTLKQGAKVRYDLVAGPKGMLAQNIQQVDGMDGAEDSHHENFADMAFRDASPDAGHRISH